MAATLIGGQDKHTAQVIITIGMPTLGVQCHRYVIMLHYIYARVYVCVWNKHIMNKKQLRLNRHNKHCSACWGGTGGWVEGWWSIPYISTSAPVCARTPANWIIKCDFIILIFFAATPWVWEREMITMPIWWSRVRARREETFGCLVHSVGLIIIIMKWDGMGWRIVGWDNVRRRAYLQFTYIKSRFIERNYFR